VHERGFLNISVATGGGLRGAEAAPNPTRIGSWDSSKCDEFDKRSRG